MRAHADAVLLAWLRDRAFPRDVPASAASRSGAAREELRKRLSDLSLNGHRIALPERALAAMAQLLAQSRDAASDLLRLHGRAAPRP